MSASAHLDLDESGSGSNQMSIEANVSPLNTTPRFSLIVATIGRTEELLILLESLAAQQLRNFELIVVDQNSDDRLAVIVEKWASEVNGHNNIEDLVQVKHLHSSPGASRARNVGLQHSRGEIVAFPDDDCWYHADTLTRVDAWFKEHREYGILSLGCRDKQGRISTNSWWQTECDLKWINIFRTTATCCYFVRRPHPTVPLSFDESIGPGTNTMFGCGEDTDFVITLMNYGIRGRFCSVPYVGHPCRDGFVDLQRAKRYGAGFGRVLAKHSCRFLFMGFLAFDFARAAAHRVLGNQERASQLWAHGKGMMSAYFSK